MVYRGPRISFFKEDAWPPAAPTPRVLLDRADQLVGRVNHVLTKQGSQRVVSRVTIHANRRLGVSLKSDTDGRYNLRTHWALLHTQDFDAALLLAVQTGRFPEELQTAFDALRSTLTKDHIYADAAHGSEQAALGDHVQLDAVLRDMSRLLPNPDDAKGVHIAWGKNLPGIRKRTIRLGSMDERKSLIRIHPVLDSPYAPRVVVEFVVWHELCHYVAPPLSTADARLRAEHRIHHPQFRALEAMYPHVAVAEQWIRDHIDALLRGKLDASNSLRS